MSDFIDSILKFIGEHSVLSYLIVFLISFSESLAFVGLIVPGTVLMIGIGVIVATGALSLWVTLLVATIGAVLGDGISYWLGRHYHRGIRRLWPFRRFPQMFERGEAFFQRHGRKSIFLGRFVGPVRAIVPVIAGMLHMPAGRFTVANVLSAIGWALAHIIPGFLLGGSLILLGAVSARLILLIVILGLLLWLAVWLVRRAFLWVTHLGDKGERLAPVFALIFFLTVWLFLAVFEGLGATNPLIRADLAIYQYLRALRTPWGDHLMIAVSELSDSVVTLSIGAAVLLVLLLHQRLWAAGFWFVAIAGGVGLVQLFKWLFHQARPIEVYQGVEGFGFPSAHTAMAVILYGFLSVLFMRSLPLRLRWLPFSAAIALASFVGFSRVYLGAHWLSGVLGGLALGWAWITLLGLFYFRRAEEKMPWEALLLTTFFTLTLVGSWQVYVNHEADLARYRVQRPIYAMSEESWWEGGWRKAPTWRIDLAGSIKEPITLQWVGDPDALAEQLMQRGWEEKKGTGWKQVLHLLIPDVAIHDLPLLPKLEEGEPERLLLSLNQGKERIVLRLWSTDVRIGLQGEPLWVGTVEVERALHVGGLLSAPRQVDDYSKGLQILTLNLSEEDRKKLVMRPETDADKVNGWNGEVLLAESERSSMQKRSVQEAP